MSDPVCFQCGRPLGSDWNCDTCYGKKTLEEYPDTVEECHAIINDLRARLEERNDLIREMARFAELWGFRFDRMILDKLDKILAAASGGGEDDE